MTILANIYMIIITFQGKNVQEPLSLFFFTSADMNGHSQEELSWFGFPQKHSLR